MTDRYFSPDLPHKPRQSSQQSGDYRGDYFPEEFQNSYGVGRGEQEPGRPHGAHVGRGPKGYRRSDERILEDVCDRLTWAAELDATDIDVSVTDGHVSLSGYVADRWQKRIAEDESLWVSGVHDVENCIRVRRAGKEDKPEASKPTRVS